MRDAHKVHQLVDLQHGLHDFEFESRKTIDEKDIDLFINNRRGEAGLIVLCQRVLCGKLVGIGWLPFLWRAISKFETAVHVRRHRDRTDFLQILPQQDGVRCSLNFAGDGPANDQVFPEPENGSIRFGRDMGIPWMRCGAIQPCTHLYRPGLEILANGGEITLIAISAIGEQNQTVDIRSG